MKKSLSVFFVLSNCLFLLTSYANEGPLKVRTRAWPTKVTLGDEIKLTVQVERPRGFSITPPSPKTPIPPFEIKSCDVSSYQEESQSVRQVFLIKVTVFQLGDLQIPPIAIPFVDSQGHSGRAWTDPVKIKVQSVIKDKKEKGDIRPIKGPVSLDLSVLRAFILSAVAFTLLLVLIIKVTLRLRRKTFVDPESLKPAHERAMIELDRLLAKPFLNEGKAKEFYTELADILRRYLERRFQVETLELTTFEILKGLKEKEIDPGLTEKIKELLDHSDLVKFAKFLPARPAADRMISLLKDVVEKTTPQKEETGRK